MFRTVSQIRVNYRHSPLSEGAAGAVRGGDRLPWVAAGPSEDNFAPLTSLDWQVHVYGDRAADLPKRAPTCSSRCTASRGSRPCSAPASSATRSTLFGPTATSPSPTLTAIRSDWAAIS